MNDDYTRFYIDFLKIFSQFRSLLFIIDAKLLSFLTAISQSKLVLLHLYGFAYAQLFPVFSSIFLISLQPAPSTHLITSNGFLLDMPSFLATQHNKAPHFLAQLLSPTDILMLGPTSYAAHNRHLRVLHISRLQHIYDKRSTRPTTPAPF